MAAEKLKKIIPEKGYTKLSFSAAAGISRPTLDKILSASVTNKVTFEKHLRKILTLLGMTAEELLFCEKERKNTPEEDEFLNARNQGRILSENAKKEYKLLLEVLNLCAEYY